MIEQPVVKKMHSRIWACPACDSNNKVTGFPDILHCSRCGVNQLAYLTTLEEESTKLLDAIGLPESFDANDNVNWQERVAL